MGMDAREFRNIVGSFCTGVTVITTCYSEKWVGMTANSFTSLSLNPMLVLFNIDKQSSTYEEFLATDSFAVNVLAATHEYLSRQFSRHGIDRFEGVPFYQDVTGSPILNGVVGYLDCKVWKRYDGGDHTIVIGEVLSGNVADEAPLAFFKGKYVDVKTEVIK
jgi:3-hydroxy-9,10-secoandrosta-1,3,5(10)-triene-9,17-dione monooxygenase reductase component